jgi:hypothetical protein
MEEEIKTIRTKWLPYKVQDSKLSGLAVQFVIGESKENGAEQRGDSGLLKNVEKEPTNPYGTRRDRKKPVEFLDIVTLVSGWGLVKTLCISIENGGVLMDWRSLGGSVASFVSLNGVWVFWC